MRVGWVLLLLLCGVPALHAFDVQVGRSFKISDISRVEGKVILPTERKKYQNIRILNKNTYSFVSSCADFCIQSDEEIAPIVANVRSAQSREGMWIVSVNFGNAWQVTFLVFQKGENYSLKSPESFVFLDSKFKSRTETLVLQAVKREVR